jgi:hypothetical protein
MALGVEQSSSNLDDAPQASVSDLEDWPVIGEDPGISIERPIVELANQIVKGSTGEDTYIDLGELGVHNVNDVRFRDSAKQGFITAYTRTREKAADHKVITSLAFSAIAIGTVITGVRSLHHNK